MANEFQVIPQPDSIPGAVTTGYQRQNILLGAQRNGFDGSAPAPHSSTEVVLPVGGPVDYNGVLVALVNPAVLTVSLQDTDYYIYLAAGGDASHYTPALTTNAGTFDASKNARYTAGGERILNWVVRRTATDVRVFRMENPQNPAILSDQGSRTTDSPSFAGLTVGGNNLAPSGAPAFAGLTLTGEFLPRMNGVGSVISLGINQSYTLPRGIWTVIMSTSGERADALIRVDGSYRAYYSGALGGTKQYGSSLPSTGSDVVCGCAGTSGTASFLIKKY